MTPTIHILNGDQLAHQLQGASYFQNQLVVREALVVGPVHGDELEEFWKIRTDFIASGYGIAAEVYAQKSIQEIERLQDIPEGSSICLWFEDDLFCQVNLWFILSLLADKPILRVFRVFPPDAPAENRWRGYADASPEELEQAYRTKVLFSNQDMGLGKSLWEAYRKHDWAALKNLSRQPYACFSNLEQVCQAQLDRFPSHQLLGRPEQIIQEILASGIIDFPSLFTEFSKRAGIYGFGDLQVKELFDYLVSSKQ
jgi:hypothetical protein